jgi:hypothetical protein
MGGWQEQLLGEKLGKEKSWQEMEPSEQAAATRLGCAPRPCSLPPPSSPTHPPARLAVFSRARSTLTRYDESSWAEGRDTEACMRRWSKLGAEEREAAESLGYHTDEWDTGEEEAVARAEAAAEDEAAAAAAAAELEARLEAEHLRRYGISRADRAAQQAAATAEALAEVQAQALAKEQARATRAREAKEAARSAAPSASAAVLAADRCMNPECKLHSGRRQGAVMMTCSSEACGRGGLMHAECFYSLEEAILKKARTENRRPVMRTLGAMSSSSAAHAVH